MALSASTVWEVRTTGNDANGGGFVTGASGTDYSQQDSAQYALTGIATAGTGAIFLSASAAANMVGNILNVVSGTNFTVGRYQVISVSVGVSVTVDRNICTGVGASGVLNIGGAIASPALAAAAKSAGNYVWIKAGTYAQTTATQNVANGMVLDNTGGSSSAVYSIWEGYQTTRGDKGTKPLLQASGAISSFVNLKATSLRVVFDNISVDCASKTSSSAIFTNSKSLVIRCKAANFLLDGIVAGADSGGLASVEMTEVTGGTGGDGFFAINGGFGTAVSGCTVHDNTTNGIGTGASISFCLVYNNAVGIVADYQQTGSPVVSCTVFGNTSAGFDFDYTTAENVTLFNCLSYGNGGYGYAASAARSCRLINCAGGNNSSGNFVAGRFVETTGFVALSATPFVASGSGNFALNTTAGGGTACRAAGYPGVMPGALSAGYQDIGAVQHADSGGGAASMVFGG